jgi:hypothetical protein
MSNDDGGPVFHDIIKRHLHLPLRFFIQGRCSLIKNQDLWTFYDGSSDGDPLFLPTRELAALNTALYPIPRVQLDILLFGASMINVTFDSHKPSLLRLFLAHFFQDCKSLVVFLLPKSLGQSISVSEHLLV